MTAIHTNRNLVCAYELLPEDMFVETWIIGSEKRYCLKTQPIDKYDEAVNWAVGMADVMARHIDVLPITGDEWLERNRESILHTAAQMTPKQQAEMDQLVVATAAKLMRDSDDPAIRATAFEVLSMMKVFQ